MPNKMHRNALQTDHPLHWYLIEDILGQGGFGITYLAHDQNLDQKVAIKEYLPIELAVREGDNSVYPVSEAHDERYSWGLDRFIKEARTLAHFKHPNIVRVVSVFEANNTAYMVMDYESGQCFQDVLSEPGHFEEAELIKILFPILGGLKLVHAAGFIHRDIKPANIFLRDDESPVLLDFGSARQALGEYTKTLTSIVSPGYAPYEQYYSKGDKQGPWTDIYGLGATMYRAITGRAPMDAIDRSEAILKTSHDVFVPAVETGEGKYSRRFLEAVDHAIQFDPDKRPQSIEEWIAEFEVPDEPDTIVAEPSPSPTPRPQADTTVFALPDPPSSEPSGSGKTTESMPGPAAEAVSSAPSIPPVTAEKASSLGTGAVLLCLLLLAGGGLYAYTAGMFSSKTPQERLLLAESRKSGSALDVPVTDKTDETEISASPLETLIKQGKQAFDDGRLSTPFNDSALFYYQSALSLDSDNPVALTGLTSIRNRLYEQAQAAQQAGNYSEARDTLIQAQAQFPDDLELQDAYRQLEVDVRQAELKKQISALLVQAKQATTDNQIAEPESSSAVFYYRKVLSLAPENRQAQAGLSELGQQLIEAANRAITASQFKQAEVLIKQAADIAPELASIKQAQQGLTEKRQDLLQQQQKKQKLQQYLAEAEDHVNALRLSSPKGRNALESFRAVLAMEPNNKQAHAGLRKIAEEYIRLADRAIQSQQLDRATSYLAKAKDIIPDAESISITESALADARRAVREQQLGQEAERLAKQQAALEQQQREQQERELSRQRAAEQARAEQREREQQQAEEQRRLAEKREAERQEQERLKAEASKKYMALKIKGINEKQFSSVQLTRSGVLERTAKQLEAQGWEIISEQQAMEKPNALMLFIRFDQTLNTSVGFYSYAISVNILERTKLALPDAVFSPNIIWNKGDSGIAQFHELYRINGIIEDQVNSFLKSQRGR